MARDQTLDKTGIGRQHLVGPDHREAVAQQDDNLGIHAGQLGRQHHMGGYSLKTLAIRIIVPMHAQQVAGIGSIGVDIGKSGLFPRKMPDGIDQFGKERQADIMLAKRIADRFQRSFVGNFGSENKSHFSFASVIGV